MRAVVALLVALSAFGCRSSDRAYQTSEGRDIGTLHPVPFRIGVAPVESGGRLDGRRKGGEPYWFTLDDGGMQQLLVALMEPDPAAAEARKLETQQAAVSVLALRERDPRALLEEAQREGADLVVVPRLVEPPRFVFEERVRTTASVAWWLGTWVGGLHVQDKRYEARMSVDFDLVNAADGTVLDTYTATSEEMDLTLWEREGRRFGRGTAQSLIMPPQLTGDQRPRVSAMLTTLVTARLAARFSGYLKEEFTRRERALLGAVRAIEPRSGSDVGPALDFRAEIIAEHPITAVAIYLNGSRTPSFEIAEGGEGAAALEPARQAAGRNFRLSVAALGENGRHGALPMAAGRNEVRLEYAVRGRYASRTLVYWNR